MKTKNIDIIIQFEGFESKPYVCSGGVDTIGFGSTRYADGTKVKLSDKAITKDEAMELLMATLGTYEDAIHKNVIAPINQNQFDALVSFVYNVGAGNFAKSTLLKKLNKADYQGASDEFLRWNRAGGKVLNGLTRRRDAERSLFLTPLEPKSTIKY
jgi:lysozyme